MRKLQESVLAKAAAALLFLGCVFVGSLCAFQVWTALPYAEADSWQQTDRFYNLIYQRQEKLASGFAVFQALENEELSYLERQQLQSELEALKAGMDPAATWFRFQIRSADGGEVIASNLQEGETLSAVVETVHYASFTVGEHQVESDLGGYKVAETSTAAAASDNAEDTELVVKTGEPVVIECGVPLDLAADRYDEFVQLSLDWHYGQNHFSGWVWVMTVMAVLSLIWLVYLLWTAGHKSGTEEIHLTWQERVFFDCYLLGMGAVVAAAFLGVLYFCDYFWRYVYYQSEVVEQIFRMGMAAASALVTLMAASIALTLRTLAVRLKAGCLARTTLICRTVGALWQGGAELTRSIPFLWKSIAGFLLYFFLNVMFFERARYSAMATVIWWAVNLAALLLLCWWGVGFCKLRQGGQAISTGNLTYQIDTRRMPHELRRHAENLNNITAGLSEAMEEKVKNERFKAELITNVSHDLKTPLTSIISYVDLLKTTRQDDPQAVEYIEVLDRKSQRLKKLTEDLVEASKASTGVLSVNREKIGMAQLLDQALAEWTEKLEERKLTVVTNLPEGETWVYADGRHLWRVIDNLLSNCAKYALEGTRIYLDLSRGKGQVSLSVKNISREALNVPAERLMERFVRGEESRSTEGSGLGLSIARSLTELQGGAFELGVDGDLFKATINLPQAN